MGSRKEASLAHQLSFKAALFSMVIAAFAVMLCYGAWLSWSHLHSQKSVEAELRDLQQALSSQAAPQENWQTFLAKLTTIPGVVNVQVYVENSQVYRSSEHSAIKPTVVAERFLITRPENGPKSHGSIRVQLDQRKVSWPVAIQAGFFFILTWLFFLLICVIFLRLVQTTVVRHLEDVTRYIAEIRADDDHIPPLNLRRAQAPRQDELDHLVAVVNKVCAQGHLAYKTMQQQREQLRQLFDAAGEIICGVDRDGLCSFVNQKAVSFFSLERENSAAGMEIKTLLNVKCRPGTFNDEFAALIEQCMQMQATIHRDDMHFVRDGFNIPVFFRCYPVMERQHCAGALIFLRDITMQYRLEYEKELFARVINQSPTLIVIADSIGIVDYVNPKFEEVLEYSQREMLGKNIQSIFRHQLSLKQKRNIASSMEDGIRYKERLTVESASGKLITLDTVISPIFDAQGQLSNIVAIARDMTRERELLNQLHHAQKMEAIGKLAASIAHEFGNPLLGIRFVLRDIQKRDELAEKDKQLLSMAEAECERIRVLIKDLQQFNRPASGKRTPFELHELLNSVVAFHRKYLKTKKIRLRRKYLDKNIILIASTSQLRQVFINLILNSCDAISTDGGEIELETVLAGETVHIIVRDNGRGISKDDLAHIFEPFFTTKDAVEGTGLGLSVSYGIVRSHGGEIYVSSQDGMTEFTIELPYEQADLEG